MRKHYLFALARVPNWGENELDGLSRIGVVPTFEKDCDRLVEGPTEVSLRFDVETHAEAQALLRAGVGNEARIISPARQALPSDLDGLTSVRTPGLVMFAQEARLLSQTPVASTP